MSPVTKQATVYYTYVDNVGITQTGNTTFTVQATGKTPSDIEHNLKKCII